MDEPPHQQDEHSSFILKRTLSRRELDLLRSSILWTPFFALAAASTWTLGLLLIKQQNPRFWMMFAFALSGLVTGLIRPEGVILASLMLLAVIVMRGFRNSISIIGTFGVTFLLLGGAYCLWRWDYFGYPLPNPFYKKGDSGLHWDSLKYSLLNTLRLCLPMAFAVIIAFRSHETTKRALAYLIPILGFASAFVLISDEMNYGARFQYASCQSPHVDSHGGGVARAFASPKLRGNCQ